MMLDGINRNKPPDHLVEEFIERFQYPIFVSVDMTSYYARLHLSLSLSPSLSLSLSLSPPSFRFTMTVMLHWKRFFLAVIFTLLLYSLDSVELVILSHFL